MKSKIIKFSETKEELNRIKLFQYATTPAFGSTGSVSRTGIDTRFCNDEMIRQIKGALKKAQIKFTSRSGTMIVQASITKISSIVTVLS